MPRHLLLQARLHGYDGFLSDAPDRHFLGRARYASLLTEVLPRGILAHLGLPPDLLGISGGGQFLLLLPEEAADGALEVMRWAADDLASRAGGALSLAFSVTDNLGDWPHIRQRLEADLQRPQRAPAAGHPAEFFAPFEPSPRSPSASLPWEEWGSALSGAEAVGWSAGSPVDFLPDGEGLRIALPAELPIVRHAAGGPDGVAAPLELARRAKGRRQWGVLRGDVDQFAARIRRAEGVDQHINLSLMVRHFFSGELARLCAEPAFGSRVTLVHTEADGFAAFGAWDALLALARELHRLFDRFVEAALRELPGREGKTLSMALALPAPGAQSLAAAYGRAGEMLDEVKTAGRDRLSALGGAVEWRQLDAAAELKDRIVHLLRRRSASPEFLREVARLHRTPPAARRARAERLERPWRYHRRLRRVLSEAATRKEQALQAGVINELLGRDAAQAKLRPSGRVAIEWAGLELG